MDSHRTSENEGGMPYQVTRYSKSHYRQIQGRGKGRKTFLRTGNQQFVPQPEDDRRTMQTGMARHSFATLICLGNGVPIETISRMMGHSSIRTTQIYAEITNQKVNRDLLRLADTTKNQYSLPDDKMTPRVYQCGSYNGWKEEEDKDDNRTSGKAM